MNNPLRRLVDRLRGPLMDWGGDSIRVDPTPMPPGSRDGRSVTVSWRAHRAKSVEVRVGAPDGPILSRSGRTGSQIASGWVRDGTTFYLQDVSAAENGSEGHTLATAVVASRLSIEQYGFGEADLLRAVGQSLGVQPQRVRLMSASAGSLVCEVRHSRGTVFLRTSPGRSDGRLDVEAWVYERLRQAGVPAPLVLALDSGRRLLPCPFLILACVNGSPLDHVLGTSSGNAAELLRHTGALLRRVHAIVLEGAGHLDASQLARTGRIAGRHDSWREAVLGLVGCALPSLEEARLLDEPTAAGIRRFVEDHSLLLDGPGRHSLLHGDFVSRHVFVDVKETSVTGFIDCEDARCGDPAFDLACFGLGAREDHVAWLLDGYDADPDERRTLADRIAIYGLVHVLAGARVHLEAGELDMAAMLAGLIDWQVPGGVSLRSRLVL